MKMKQNCSTLARPSQVIDLPLWQPIAIVLLVQCLLFVWLADRAFEFTDEAFYLLSYTGWRDQLATVTFFGAYFEWVYRALDHSIAGIRIFSLLALMATSGLFARECLEFDGGSPRVGLKNWRPFILAVVSTSLFYFGYLATVRAPSYNLVSVCAMLLSTGLLLRVLRFRQFGTQKLLLVFAYGLGIGASFLSKATTGALAVVIHVIFFGIFYKDWRIKPVVLLIATALAGFLTNFLIIQISHPDWLHSLLEGIQVSNARGGGYGALELVNSLRWDIQRVAPVTILAIFLTSATIYFLQRAPQKNKLNINSLAIFLLTLASAYFFIREQRTLLWLPALLTLVLACWTLHLIRKEEWKMLPSDWRTLALTALLLTLPIIVSFGTNMRVLQHSQIAAVFPATAFFLVLKLLWEDGKINRISATGCLTLMSALPIFAQINSIFNADYTYRQFAPLIEQNRPVKINTNAAPLLVDIHTHKTLADLTSAAKTSGLKPDQPVLDLTGDGSGLIVALGARALGTAWTGGGYPGSSKATDYLISKIPSNQLAGAWILSSEDNPRRIIGWQDMLKRKLGVESHQLVATVSYQAPYFWRKDAPTEISVQIWKPLGTTSKQLVP